VYEYTLQTGKGLSHVEGLGQEALYAARTAYDELVLFRQFVHPEDRNNILEFLVPLQDILHALRAVVMLVANNFRAEDTRRGIERVHRWIDTQLGDLTEIGRASCRERGQGAGGAGPAYRGIQR